MKIIDRKKINSEEVLGQFIGHEYWDLLIKEDMDLYASALDGSRTEDNIILKFRKGVFTKEEQDLAYSGLREAAQETQNRGLAAGPRGTLLHSEGRGGREWVSEYQLDVLDWFLRPDNELDDSVTIEDIRKRHKDKTVVSDTRGYVWLRSKVIKEYGDKEYFGWFDRWVNTQLERARDAQRSQAQYVKDEFISVTNYAQTVVSGIAGYYGRYPRLPYGRATSYTEKNIEMFSKCYPYLHKLDDIFRKELPVRYKKQNDAAKSADPHFLIDDTVFSTLTVNHNWRTACHRDAGDFSNGFSNISTLGKGWQGAEFILPEYRVAVKLEPGDLLLVNNHEGIHGNMPLIGEDNDRLSIVAYFREDILDLKSWEYECARKKYCEGRRNNKNHPLWYYLWNGISTGMFYKDEWYEFLKAENIEDPYSKEGSSLENFFD